MPTDRERALAFIEKGVSDPTGETLRFSTLAGFKADDLFRVWAFIESFRPEGEKQTAAPNIWPWAGNVPKPTDGSCV